MSSAPGDIWMASIPVIGAVFCTFGGALVGYWLENRRKDWRSLKRERTRYLGELIKMREIEDIYLEFLSQAGEKTNRSYKLKVYAAAEERGIGKPVEGRARLKKRFAVVGE